MKRALFLLAVFGLLTSATATAQNWNAEQLEVWDFEKQCWQSGLDNNLEANRSCFHEDYQGWYSANPTPMPVISEAAAKRSMEMDRQVAYNMTPHHIMIYGDVAIVHLTGSITVSQEDGPDKTSWYHWTDIVLKENGRWSWIADHGHPAASD